MNKKNSKITNVYSKDKQAFDKDKWEIEKNKRGFERDKEGVESDKEGVESDKEGVESDKKGFGSDKDGVEKDSISDSILDLFNNSTVFQVKDKVKTKKRSNKKSKNKQENTASKQENTKDKANKSEGIINKNDTAMKEDYNANKMKDIVKDNDKVKIQAEIMGKNDRVMKKNDNKDKSISIINDVMGKDNNINESINFNKKPDLSIISELISYKNGAILCELYNVYKNIDEVSKENIEAILSNLFITLSLNGLEVDEVNKVGDEITVNTDEILKKFIFTNATDKVGDVKCKVEYLGWKYKGKRVVPMVVKPII